MKYLLLLLSFSLAGCAEVKPLPYQSNSDIKPGAGLLTGEQGEFVLYQGDPFPKKGASSKNPNQAE